MSNSNYLTLQNLIDEVNDKLDIEIQLYRADAISGKYGLSVPGRDNLVVEK